MKTKCYETSVFYKVCYIVIGIILFSYGMFFEVLTLETVCIIGGMMLLGLMLYQKEMTFDFKVIVLLVAFMLISVHDAQFELEGEVYKVAAPIIMYLLGRALAGSDTKSVESRVVLAYLALAGGLFIHGILDFSNNYRLGVNSTEVWPDFFQNMDMARTAYEFNFIFTTAMMFYVGVQIIRNKKKIYVLAIVAEVIVLIFAVKAEGRYNLLMLFVSVFALACVYIICEWTQIKTKTRNAIKYIVIAGCVLVAILGVVFKLNIFGLHDIYSNSYLSGSGGILHNVRFLIMREGFKAVLEQPLGGVDILIMDHYRSSHDMWIDYGMEFGLTVFLCLMLFQIMTCIDLVKMIINKNISAVKYLLAGAFICINIYFIMEGVPSLYDQSQLWIFGLIINGMTMQLTTVDNKVKKIGYKYDREAYINK